MRYTREQIDTICEAKDPDFMKIRYGDGETGWAIKLADGNAIIVNTPLEPRLCYRDVVEVIGPCGDRWPRAGRVLWRYYAKKTGVIYPVGDSNAETLETYRKICDACTPHGLHVEGHTAGICGVSHHKNTDLAAILAGIEGLELRTDWQNGDDDDVVDASN